MLYALSLLVVFLCLAALYESWSIPVAVLLVVPLGLVGAVLAVTLRGLENDVYLQVGLLTTMGLSAKNAILMVEFAERAEKQGKRAIDAAIEAARIRLRPILMTSLAFIFGVLPLAIATGAGANSRVAIGTAVIGGMIDARPCSPSSTFRSSSSWSAAGTRDGGRATSAIATARRREARAMKRFAALLALLARAAAPRSSRIMSGPTPPVPRVLAGRRCLSAPERGGAAEPHLPATSSAIRGCRR